VVNAKQIKVGHQNLVFVKQKIKEVVMEYYLLMILLCCIEIIKRYTLKALPWVIIAILIGIAWWIVCIALIVVILIIAINAVNKCS
jgi:hypothetical protein